MVLPGSPNRGMFGGDGAYGEAKSALDAVVSRWNAESSWAQRVSLAHALIGWTRGTGLMGHNDAIVSAVEEAGVTTYSTEEMAAMLLGLCDVESKVAAASSPIKADLTGGLGEVDLDMAELAAKAREEMTAEAGRPTRTLPTDGHHRGAAVAAARIHPGTAAGVGRPRRRPGRSGGHRRRRRTRPVRLVAHPLRDGGRQRTVGRRCARTGLDHRADQVGRRPQAGLVRHRKPVTWSTRPSWSSATTTPWWSAVGIREFVDDGAIDPDHASPLLVSVFLDKDFTLRGVVGGRRPGVRRVRSRAHGGRGRCPTRRDWQVTRKAGTEIRVPRKTKLSRTVGAQIPTGFDPTVWGISPDMASSIDRVALWNIVATVDAFLSAGFSPAELMRWVHPSLVASTQGTGMGGMTSMQTMYHGNLLGRNKPNDILQEVLPNVVAAHVVQSYVGSYGSMIHPVAACATAAVSVEEGVDKIRLGKAELVVAGGFDDLTLEAIIGFGDMAATADTVDDARPRASATRSSPAPTTVAGWASSRPRAVAPSCWPVVTSRSRWVCRCSRWWATRSRFADGVHTSIPAPGLGALGAGRGGKDSALARSLAKLGVGADDIAVISKHDTSTLANDPNETELHERLADSMGRSDGAPLFVVSQKSLTGHAKGGAAVFQMMGLCQILRDGVIPPNRSLDCVDDELAGSGALRLGARDPAARATSSRSRRAW